MTLPRGGGGDSGVEWGRGDDHQGTLARALHEVDTVACEVGWFLDHPQPVHHVRLAAALPCDGDRRAIHPLTALTLTP